MLFLRQFARKTVDDVVESSELDLARLSTTMQNLLSQQVLQSLIILLFDQQYHYSILLSESCSVGCPEEFDIRRKHRGLYSVDHAFHDSW